MRSTEKTILFARVTMERKTQQWPVATFNTPISAKTYAAYLKMAHSADDVERVKQLDPRAKIDANGHLVPGVKLSILTVPYEPSAAPVLSDADLLEEVSAE